MKKQFITLLALAGMATAQAEDNDYPYLMFQTTDGTTTAVASSNLTITFSDGKLIATDANTGTQTFTLTDLSKMFFSTDATGIEETEAETDNEAVEVFTTTGISLGKFENMKEAQSALERGIYVMKSKSRTLKIAVK